MRSIDMTTVLVETFTLIELLATAVLTMWAVHLFGPKK